MAFSRETSAVGKAVVKQRMEEAIRGSKHNSNTLLSPMVRAEIIGHLRTNVLPNSQRLDDVFTLMALVYGPPDWGRSIAWVDILEHALDIPKHTFTMTEGDEWLRTYENWYQENQRG